MASLQSRATRPSRLSYTLLHLSANIKPSQDKNLHSLDLANMRSSTILAAQISASTVYAAVINAAAAPVEARDGSPTPADAPTPFQDGNSPDLVARAVEIMQKGRV
ncbi:hypothetical protein GGTG_12407 [Gaeumannomyces tritici R3-111a-1]|uniref:Uncharacterized protein n=1 Tax=Gaeumannomyces tritici (strain R3-111a-1) TaxID=644352 RepID=J3PFY2_GAET3|nr:hypothetical protein GGTG_12407 [Gaeumannomyces tritici R3-111a-1]EJT70234.1 hypothetical protein GGTG_12407 [Gaeumannomyces tritici R3-111a-1]